MFIEFRCPIADKQKFFTRLILLAHPVFGIYIFYRVLQWLFTKVFYVIEKYTQLGMQHSQCIVMRKTTNQKRVLKQ